MARAASSAPNFSSSNVSIMMVRGTSGSTVSSKAFAASSVEPNMSTRAWGMVPVVGMFMRSTARSTATLSHPPR